MALRVGPLRVLKFASRVEILIVPPLTYVRSGDPPVRATCVREVPGRLVTYSARNTRIGSTRVARQAGT